ncbi:hypothetical protein [Actinoplanes sp. NPDC026670]|uniref:hypothetical protein n=1 Tax=Actinoplanes sp. NPDC026670 TaxID=3154700 RepID=UPI0033DC80BC
MKTTTHFAGVDFPTLLHAQWALFFHDLLMPWQFRPVSFTLASGHEYEPDFWLPNQQLWFQVGDDRYHHEDLDQWREFAHAAEQPRDTPKPIPPGTRTDPHHARATQPLPEQWRSRTALYSAGGIPVPEEMTPAGPMPADYASMYSAAEGWYQWTSCPTCHTIGAEAFGNADRLDCGHGNHRRDHDYRANDLHLLAAYRLARQTISAQLGGRCADCDQPLNIGDLAGAGRRVAGRRWYHADCLLAARRKRFELRRGTDTRQEDDDGHSDLLAG